jgi:hypothetical protein
LIQVSFLENIVLAQCQRRAGCSQSAVLLRLAKYRLAELSGALVAQDGGAKMPCSVCGELSPLYDHEVKSWRHLNFW